MQMITSNDPKTYTNSVLFKRLTNKRMSKKLWEFLNTIVSYLISSCFRLYRATLSLSCICALCSYATESSIIYFLFSQKTFCVFIIIRLHPILFTLPDFVYQYFVWRQFALVPTFRATTTFKMFLFSIHCATPVRFFRHNLTIIFF